MSGDYDAVVVGAGPNGLAAAITLANSGCKVLVLEGGDTIGGGCRTRELTLPGFRHDICSAVHPLGLASPFFRKFPEILAGVDWIFTPLQLAHPFDDGSVVTIDRSIKTTAANLGKDGTAYLHLIEPLVENWEKIVEDMLGPLPLPPHHPLALIEFGLRALPSANVLARLMFRQPQARAVFAGMAAHAMLPLNATATSAFGLVLAMLAHAVGWPIPGGGSQSIIDGMAKTLAKLGGEIQTNTPVKSLNELPKTKVVLLDITPRQILKLAGDLLPAGYRRALNKYRYGPGVYKIDYALDGPIPWQDKRCLQTGTVHLGGTLEQISASEQAVWHGEHADRPYMIVVQQSLFDPTRAPQGKQTAWVYCHVPNGSSFDMTGRMEAQIERFAPGFRELILARKTHSAIEMEAYNPNYIGGDINGGVQDLAQLFMRPVARWVPYSTPLKNLYICSSSTPPGGGVHGMCGYHAARAVLKTF